MSLQKRISGTPIYEASAAVGDPITLTIDEPDQALTHWFLGADYFDSAALDTPVTPGAGTIDVTVVSLTTDLPSTPNGSPIDCTATTDVEGDFSSNPKTITFTPAGITTATHYRVRAVGNMT